MKVYALAGAGKAERNSWRQSPCQEHLRRTHLLLEGSSSGWIRLQPTVPIVPGSMLSSAQALGIHPFGRSFWKPYQLPCTVLGLGTVLSPFQIPSLWPLDLSLFFHSKEFMWPDPLAVSENTSVSILTSVAKVLKMLAQALRGPC